MVTMTEPANMSMAQRVALLSREEREEVLEGMDLAMLQYDWSFWRRPDQTIPMPNSATTILLMGGRGSGKTRNACEWVREKARTMPGSRGLLTSRTAADARDVMVNGESGLLAIHPPSEMPLYEPSKRLLTWPNGTIAQLYSSETPDSLRGPQGHWGVAEELATWYTIPDDSGLTAWDNLQIAVRLGDLPQILVASTPKRTAIMRELFTRAANDPRVMMLHSTTRENMGNLSEVYIETIYRKYKGTALEAQELDGLLMEEVQGALWSSEVLDRTRVEDLPRDVDSFVVAVDPSVSENKGDLAGITLVGSTSERLAMDRSIYVVEDASLQGTPKEWVEKAVTLAQQYDADIVIEKNQGGRLLTDAIHQVDHRMKVHPIQARASKQLRAEPVVLSFQRGQSHLVGEIPMLEAELLSWVPDLKMKSPDRLDSMVYGVSYFLTDAGRGGYRPRARGTLTSAGRRRLPQSQFVKRSRGW
jgi:phage terminase large subunit-like protein